MNIVKEYLEKYEIGFLVFERLFNMKSEELSNTLDSILGAHRAGIVLNEKPNFYKYIENDKPTKIKICSWDTIEITPLGIYYKGEYGDMENVTLFTKHFKL